MSIRTIKGFTSGLYSRICCHNSFITTHFTEFTVPDALTLSTLKTTTTTKPCNIRKIKQGKNKWVWKASKYLSQNLRIWPQTYR